MTSAYQSWNARGECRIDVGQIVDKQQIGIFNITLLIVIALSITLNGYDIFGLGFLIPPLIKVWHANPAALCSIFGIGMVSIILGTPLFGWLGDRYGPVVPLFYDKLDAGRARGRRAAATLGNDACYLFRAWQCVRRTRVHAARPSFRIGRPGGWFYSRWPFGGLYRYFRAFNDADFRPHRMCRFPHFFRRYQPYGVRHGHALSGCRAIKGRRLESCRRTNGLDASSGVGRLPRELESDELPIAFDASRNSCSWRAAFPRPYLSVRVTLWRCAVERGGGHPRHEGHGRGRRVQSNGTESERVSSAQAGRTCR